jgi:hypothetical protein
VMTLVAQVAQTLTRQPQGPLDGNNTTRMLMGVGYIRGKLFHLP